MPSPLPQERAQGYEWARTTYIRRLLRTHPFGGFLGVVLLLCGTSCMVPVSMPVAVDSCFLANTEERVYSEILQGQQRIVMTFELVDGVAPRTLAVIDGLSGYWIPAGAHRLQFRVFLPPVGWNNGRGREVRAVVDLELHAGCRYKITGDFSKGIRTFYLADAISGQAITQPIDIGFFAPVPGPKGFIPILIPIRP